MGRGSCVTEGRASGQAQLRAVMWEPPHPPTEGPLPLRPSLGTSALPSLVPRPTPLPIPRVRRMGLSPLQRRGHQTQGTLGVPQARKPLLAVTSALVPTRSVLPAKGQLSAWIMSKAFLAELPALARRPGWAQSVPRGCTMHASRMQGSSAPVHREQLVSPCRALKYHSEVVVLLAENIWHQVKNPRKPTHNLCPCQEGFRESPGSVLWLGLFLALGIWH